MTQGSGGFTHNRGGEPEFKIHVTQPNDHLGKVLKLEEEKRKSSYILQNGATNGWIMQEYQ